MISVIFLAHTYALPSLLFPPPPLHVSVTLTNPALHSLCSPSLPSLTCSPCSSPHPSLCPLAHESCLIFTLTLISPSHPLSPCSLFPSMITSAAWISTSPWGAPSWCQVRRCTLRTGTGWPLSPPMSTTDTVWSSWGQRVDGWRRWEQSHTNRRRHARRAASPFFFFQILWDSLVYSQEMQSNPLDHKLHHLSTQNTTMVSWGCYPGASVSMSPFQFWIPTQNVVWSQTSESLPTSQVSAAAQVWCCSHWQLFLLFGETINKS